MYKLVKRPDSPNWQLHIFGKRISLRTANRVLAQKKALQIEEYMILNRLDDIKPIKLNLIALEVKKEIEQDYQSPSTSHQYCNYVDSFMSFIGLHTYVHEITPLQCVDYFRMVGKTHTASTLRKYKRAVRILFYYAKLHRHIVDDPLDEMLIHTHKSKIKTKPPRKNKPIPWDFVLKALEQAPEKYKTWWTIMAYTGLDPKDAATIQKWQINNGILSVDRSKTKEPVLIPLHQKLLAMDIFNAFKYTASTRSASISAFKSIFVRLGYKENVNFKSLRHTYNTMLNFAGISQVERAKMMGHKSVSTQEVYTHGELKRFQKAINEIP